MTGLDVQITELDVATESSYKPATLAFAYNDLFTMFIKRGIFLFYNFTPIKNRKPKLFINTKPFTSSTLK